MRSPSQILGNNLAVCLQSDIGTGPGLTVPRWMNQSLHGDAVQGSNSAPPTLVPFSFGSKPGVSCQLDTQGLVLTLDQPVDVGQRPYMWVLARMNKLVHDFDSFQPLVLLGDSALTFTNSISLSAYASGAFDANAYWDCDVITGVAQDTFLEVPEVDLAPHVFEASLDSLIVDNTVMPSASDPGGVTQLLDLLVLSNNQPAGAPASTAGFWNMGIVVMSYDTPTPLQIAEVAEWCANYGR